MDIYIAIDNQEWDKFKPVAAALKNRIEKDKLAAVKNFDKYTKDTAAICIVFSNSVKYVENVVKDVYCDAINVTDNMNSKYILSVLNYVKDIYYLKADINVLISKLVSRLKCVKQCKE